MTTKHQRPKHASSSKRRRYQADPMAFNQVIAMSRPMPFDDNVAFMARVRLAFQHLKDGGSDTGHFHILANALNVAEVRAADKDPLAEETILKGQAALKECDGLFARHGHYGFTGPGLTAVADAVQLYEDILQASSPLQLEAARMQVARAMLAAGQEVAHV